MQIDGSGSSLVGAEGAADATARSGSCGAPDVPFCVPATPCRAVILR